MKQKAICRWMNPLCLLILSFFPLLTNANTEENGTVLYIHDGDTIVVRIGNVIEKVRLIGIDAPELKDPRTGMPQCASNEARKKLQAMISKKTVRLIRDAKTKNRDTYGRLLRYVYRDQLFVNPLLIQEGFARVYTRFPFEHSKTFKTQEQTAREKNLWLWNSILCARKK